MPIISLLSIIKYVRYLINKKSCSFSLQELGIYDNETFIRQIYYDYIEGKSSSSSSSSTHGLPKSQQDSSKIALHEKILKEYLEKMNETTEAEHSINWVTHQKCKDMFILSKVRKNQILLEKKQLLDSLQILFFDN